MLMLMALNFMVATPIMCIGGIFMALREDLNLSWLVWVSVPLLVVVVGYLVVRLMPLFRSMQKKIDRLNGVLREQIIGIRVVRAFVREPHEAERFGAANKDLTDVSLKIGSLFVLMFPAIGMILHVSTAAVLWFGGQRVDAGEMQVGSLTAFLQYLLADPDGRHDGHLHGHDDSARLGLRRPHRRGARRRTLHPRAAHPGGAGRQVRPRRIPERVLRLPRRRSSGAERHQLHRRARARPWRSSAPPAPASPACWPCCRGSTTPPRVKSCSTASPSPTLTGLGHHPARRHGAAAALPVLRDHRAQPALRQARGHGRRNSGRR